MTLLLKVAFSQRKRIQVSLALPLDRTGSSVRSAPHLAPFEKFLYPPHGNQRRHSHRPSL